MSCTYDDDSEERGVPKNPPQKQQAKVPPVDSRTPEFQAGKRAYSLGFGEHDCPHKSGKSRIDWLAGNINAGVNDRVGHILESHGVGLLDAKEESVFCENETFADYLKQCRLGAGFGMRELAEKAGIAAEKYIGLEAGAIVPSGYPREINKIANALELPAKSGARYLLLKLAQTDKVGI